MAARKSGWTRRASEAGADTREGGWLSFLGNRLLLALLAVSLLPLALMGIATYRAAASTLKTQAFSSRRCHHPQSFCLCRPSQARPCLPLPV
jgi:hypothetical protein